MPEVVVSPEPGTPVAPPALDWIDAIEVMLPPLDTAESEEEEETCSNCETAPCICRDCPACGSAEYEFCDHCLECTGCCDCVTCAGGNYGHLVDPDDSDERICSNCSRCEDRHCECSSCGSCGSRSEDSTCENCDRCDDCCECVRCEGCEEFSRSLACSGCNRCEDCGCNCESEDDHEDEDEEEELPPSDTNSTTTSATVTYNLPNHAQGTICDVCQWGRCVCQCCWARPVVGGIPTVAHRYIGAQFTNETRCPICHTCEEHCGAVEVCPTCTAEGTNRKVHTLCTICGGCPNHCECRQCCECRGKVKTGDFCERCCNCLSHCKCLKCVTCGKRGVTICDYCKQCSIHCNDLTSTCGAIRRGQPIPYTSDLPLKFFRPANLLGFHTNTCHRDVGIEIEVNSCTKLGHSRPLFDTIKKWNIAVKPDGSIGGQPEAFELNMMPSSGDTTLEILKDVCDGLDTIGANPNEQCGVHVHVNASDIQGDDLKRVVDVYALVERALFDLCHPRRLNYTYSTICGKLFRDMGRTGAELRKNLVKHLFYSDREPPATPTWARGLDRNRNLKNMGEVIKEQKQNLHGSKRYRALNLASYFRRGTIEFRHMENSKSYEDISGWAMTVAGVIDGAVRMSHKQVKVLPTNSRKALLAVVPAHLHEWIFAKWARMDAIVNSSSGYKAKRKQHWGL